MIIPAVGSALISGLLIFGAYSRNSAAIFTWVIFAIIENGYFFFMALYTIIQLFNIGAPLNVMVSPIFWFAVAMIFYAWAINVGINANQEVKMEKNVINVATCQMKY